MLVHYSVPHGLEQYGGAAWGTRDVCQGPVEYFMATQKYHVVKELIKTIYSHINMMMMATGRNGSCLTVINTFKLVKAMEISSFGH